MGLSQIKCCLILVLCLSIFTSLSVSTSFPDHIFMPQGVTERRLLQVLKPCPVDFEHQNYSIITSKCRGPNYQTTPCCSAFKEFACPFVDDLDDLSNDCASRMFAYIKLNGKYPPGLFASLCREGMEGLACPDPPPRKNGSTRTTITTCDGFLLTIIAWKLLLIGCVCIFIT